MQLTGAYQGRMSIAAKPGSGSGGSFMIKVLYTDDESGLLEIGKLFLERSGELRVETAISAPEAIRMLKDHSFDVIVSDYQMPGMDGIELLKNLRGRCGGIPLILFTGSGRE